MQDNFNIREWQLTQAIKELNEKKLCTECGTGYMEEGQCMECGYMEEGFPDLSGDGKITQKDILIGKGVIKKEAISRPLTALYDLVEELVAQGFTKDDILRVVNFATAKLDEGIDHEVSMAQNSLKSIISSASQLINKLGNDERNIPGWIQDHIINAENYIDQAAQGFHELDNEYEED